MTRQPRRTMRRRLRAERLESRLLLAADNPFQNPGLVFDVNNDLEVTAADALQVINFMTRNLDSENLPDTNTGTNFPDTNGSGGVTAQDAITIVNRLGPNGPQLLAGRLVRDSAPGGAENIDFITNDFRLEFGTTNVTTPQDVLLRVNQQGPFMVAGQVSNGGSLTLSEFDLSLLSNGTIGPGDNVFEAMLPGNEETIEFVVTIDKSAPFIGDLRLSFDTDSGFSHIDGITSFNSPVLVGEAEEGSQVTVTIETLANGDTVFTGVTESADGIWELGIGVLADGTYIATAFATDIAGNFSGEQEFEITIDTTPPIVPQFGFLAGSVFDTPLGPATLSSSVTIVGDTSPDADLVLHSNLQTYLESADSNGDFEFQSIDLESGENLLTLLAIDQAGNQSTFSETVIQLFGEQE
ncbi:MAG: Ig-like domain-containing protein [Rubripirellula sp.]